VLKFFNEGRKEEREGEREGGKEGGRKKEGKKKVPLWVFCSKDDECHLMEKG
jgi:hypothetical protein